jgi:hypothetical protein
MKKYPIAVLVIAVVYILAGALGLVSHGIDLWRSFDRDMIWAVLTGALGVVAGIFLLRGQNWARWLALAWILLHVVISIYHSKAELATHCVFCVLIAYFLFRPATNEYFGTPKSAN